MSPVETQNQLLNKMYSLEQQASSELIIPASQSDMSADFSQVVRAINAQQNLASAMTSAVSTGESEDVVGAMVASQKASLSFSMLMEMRNKILNGVDDVMRMSL